MSLDLSETPKTDFVASRPKCASEALSEAAYAIWVLYYILNICFWVCFFIDFLQDGPQCEIISLVLADQVRHKTACLATETSWNIAILHIER